jgi:hypothetical protein
MIYMGCKLINHQWPKRRSRLGRGSKRHQEWFASPRRLERQYVVELSLVTGLDLDPLCHLAASIDPVAFQGSEDGFEAALLVFEAALQGLDHISMDRRVRKVHVE